MSEGALKDALSNLPSDVWLGNARLVASAIVALPVCFSSPASCTASEPPAAHVSLALPHVCASFNTVFNLDARITLVISFVLLKMRQDIAMYRGQPHMLCHSNLNLLHLSYVFLSMYQILFEVHAVEVTSNQIKDIVLF